MYRALYRKWRPRTFDDIVGQPQVTDILKYQVGENRVSHAYLFCGSRGTGKTSCAKVLAKAVNCLHPVNGNPCNECEACRSIDAGTATDVIEMDAASNNGVDNVRDMKEEIVFTPAELKYRVYIIDEVHMMSGSAFNALLKTLEEPPSYVLFILATTELNKLPSTIVSRCQRYDFRRLPTDLIVSYLGKVAKAEGISLTDGGARVIARIALGGMRDSLSLLELCAGTNEEVNEKLCARVLGIGSREAPAKVVDALADKDYQTLYSIVSEVVSSSQDIAVFWGELIACFRDLVVVKTLGEGAISYLDLSDSEFRSLSDRAVRLPLARLLYQSKLLEETLEVMKRGGVDRRTSAELALTRMCEPRLSSSPEALTARIEELERKLALLSAGGVPAPQPVEEPKKQDKQPEKEQDAPKPAPVAPSPAPARPVGQAPQKAAAAPADSGKSPIPGWGSILDEIGEIKPHLVPFLKGSSAVVSNGEVTVSLSVSMFLPLVSRDQSAAGAILHLLNGKGIAANTLKFVTAPQQKKNDGQYEF